MDNNIRQLVLSFFNMQGIKCEEVEEKIWEAKIPEKMADVFNCDSTLRFTFDREKAELHRNVEIVCEGSFLLSKIIEKLASMSKVSRLFVVHQSDVPESTGVKSIASKMHYKPFLAFNFKVSVDCDQKREMLYSVVEDFHDSSLKVNKKLFTLNLEESSEKPDPRIKLGDYGSEVLKVYLQACQKLEESIQEEVKGFREASEAKCREDMKVFDAYLNEQKTELLQKKENVSFHLYFFQKEEEIDKLISNLEEERKRKLNELEEKYRVKVGISLINAVIICVPESGVGKPAGSVAKVVKINK